jgi:hypothetical protein
MLLQALKAQEEGKERRPSEMVKARRRSVGKKLALSEY